MSDIPKELQDDVAKVLEILSSFTYAGRLHIFGEIKSKYCIHCGDEQQKNGHCQCTNDEWNLT